MSHKNNSENKTNIWVKVGAIVLIVILLIWLTVAMASGDTDVAAFINPVIG